MRPLSSSESNNWTQLDNDCCITSRNLLRLALITEDAKCGGELFGAFVYVLFLRVVLLERCFLGVSFAGSLLLDLIGLAKFRSALSYGKQCMFLFNCA